MVKHRESFNQANPSIWSVLAAKIKETQPERRPLSVVTDVARDIERRFPGSNPPIQRLRARLLKRELEAYELVYQAAVDAEKLRRAAVEQGIAADFGVTVLGRDLPKKYGETLREISLLPGGEEMIALARQTVDHWEQG